MTQTILVTGANRGIGFEHAQQALAAGDDVIAACRKPEDADALRSLSAEHPDHLRIEALDVGKAASVSAFAERMAGVPIDILINNAGLYGGSWPSDGHRQTVEGMDYDHWQDMLQVNVIGPFRLTAVLLPNLMLGARKTVVMMSSDLGSITNNTQGQSHGYRSSKAALNMLTRGLAIDLRDRGVSVYAMAPGWTKTELGGEGATWEVDDSVSRQRKVIDGFDASMSGGFFDLTGAEVPW